MLVERGRDGGPLLPTLIYAAFKEPRLAEILQLKTLDCILSVVI